MVIWITGLPGAGKTTIATSLFKTIKSFDEQVVLLDGDMVREALQNTEYDLESRKKLAFSYSRFAKMFSEQGQITIFATVSMFDDVRQWNQKNIENYFEIYIKVFPEVLNRRNQKQLYSEALKGKIKNLHGFDLDFEEPKNPSLIVDNNGSLNIKNIVSTIINTINESSLVTRLTK
ncbi:MAG: adenylylsulfate kinase-like enzyme [Colwellia sp.]|jgi:adenylylsulfate kinase-like enzyme